MIRQLFIVSVDTDSGLDDADIEHFQDLMESMLSRFAHDLKNANGAAVQDWALKVERELTI